MADTTLEENSTLISEAQDLAASLPDAGGGTDISLGLTGAAVGDIIKVKAVDESGKPTEWEAAKDSVDAKYQEVQTEVSVKLDSENGGLSSYTFDVDIDKDRVIIIHIIYPESIATGYVRVYDQLGVQITYHPGGTYRSLLMAIKKINGRYFGGICETNNLAGRSSAPICLYFNQLSGVNGYSMPRAGNITSLKIVTSATFPEGTNIIIITM